MTENTETVRIHKLINGKLYPLELRRQRFEQTMDRIDAAVDRGRSFKEICNMFSQHIVNSGAKALAPVEKSDAPSQPVGTKAEIVSSTIAQFPALTASEIAKKVAANHPITYANAYYLAGKMIKKAK